MPAAKTLRAQQRKASINRSTRSFTRSRVKAVSELIESSSKSDDDSVLRSAISALDKAVTKGVLHRNTAARKKSRLAKQYNKLTS